MSFARGLWISEARFFIPNFSDRIDDHLVI